MGNLFNLAKFIKPKAKNINDVEYTKKSTSIGKIRHEYVITSLVLFFLVTGIILDYYKVSFFTGYFSVTWYIILYIVVGGKTIIKAFVLLISRDFYNEFVMMFIATLGMLLVGSFAEAVAVMLIFTLGELIQDSLVNKSKETMESMLKIPVNDVSVINEEKVNLTHPKNIGINQIIKINPDENIILDGILISETAILNTAMLTGDNDSYVINHGKFVLAGMVNLNKAIQIKVKRKFKDTKLSKNLKLLQEALDTKSKNQILISQLAKNYTILIFWFTVALVVIPYFFMGDNYIFQTWVQRALIFLVVSFPIGLITSLSLGYFEGISSGFRNGIIFKGSNYLDLMAKVDTVVMDKTEILIKEKLKIQDIEVVDFNKEKLLKIIAVLEKNSSHPVAKAIVDYANFDNTSYKSSNIEEFLGLGISGKVNKYEILIGNAIFLDRYKINYDKNLLQKQEPIVMIAINQKIAGYIHFTDSLQNGGEDAISKLKKIDRIKNIVILSDDKKLFTDQIGKKYGGAKAIGNLLLEEKIKQLKKIKEQGKIIAIVGNSMYNSSLIDLADVGIILGGLQKDTYSDTADVIIQTSNPSKILVAIRIGKTTKNIIWQNIWLVLSVKILILILAAFGLVTMWIAVIIDVFVTVLVLLNSKRIQKIKF